VADDSEESDGEDNLRPGEVQVLAKDEIEARKRIEQRHEINREFQSRSADEIAKDYESRHKQEERYKKKYEKDGGLTADYRNVATTQSLLPSLSDPSIFRVKCKPGMEIQLVSSLIRKAVDSKNKKGLLRIKSAFFTGVKGMIYVEAISESFAKEAMSGLTGLYAFACAQIYIQEMTSVLSVKMTKKPLKLGQWVRLKRGPMKGDLARIVKLFDGGEKAFIQAVPRIDYNAISQTSSNIEVSKKIMKTRPPLRLFDAEEAKASALGSSYRRVYHPKVNSKTPYEQFNEDYYKDGLLYKEVKVATYINNETDAKPTLTELQLFKSRKETSGDNTKNGDNDDEVENDIDRDVDDDEEVLQSGDISNNVSLVKELAEQIKNIGEEEEKSAIIPFVVGLSYFFFII
jgi:transcription elongation factor SPT5